jgi:hypothetical protein
LSQPLRRGRRMGPKRILNWLLDENQPSIRYLTLTTLPEKPDDDDPEVQSTKEMITEKGWAASILAKQMLGG